MDITFTTLVHPGIYQHRQIGQYTCTVHTYMYIIHTCIHTYVCIHTLRHPHLYMHTCTHTHTLGNNKHYHSDLTFQPGTYRRRHSGQLPRPLHKLVSVYSFSKTIALFDELAVFTKKVHAHTQMRAHTPTYTHTHVTYTLADLFFSFAFFKASAVLSDSSTLKDVTFGQVTLQLVACRKVVKKDMVISAFQVPCEVFDDPLTQLLLSTALLTSIDL